MENPFLILNISTDATIEEIISAHLMACRGKSDLEKRELSKARQLLVNDLNREKVKIHCLKLTADEILIYNIKKAIKPW